MASKVGTGNINPFLDLHESPAEEGFNTDGAFSYTQARTSWTNPVPLNMVPPITGADIPAGMQAGTSREFVLDLNESNSIPDTLVSLDFWVMWLCKDNAT